jgi:uracil-DNA glycosylase family 4
MFDVNEFDALCDKVQKCVKCPRMCDSQRVLNRSGGSLNADIMFIGEAPGRLGADNTGIPFHGDKSGHNFEELLEFAKLDRSRIFVTNAVLCNPRDEEGNNSTPTKIEVQNCADHLAEQIRIINPKVVVTLGATALESTRFTSPHTLVLREAVRTGNEWFNRILIPLYHPGQRAMMHNLLLSN